MASPVVKSEDKTWCLLGTEVQNGCQAVSSDGWLSSSASDHPSVPVELRDQDPESASFLHGLQIFSNFFHALRRNRCVFCRIYIAPFFRLYGAIVFELIDRRERSIALLGGDVEEYASGFSFFYYISLNSFYLLFSILVLYFRMYGNSAYLGAVF